MRRTAGVLAAVVLVLAVGTAAFVTARSNAAPDDPGADLPPPAGTDPARTYVVDGRAYSCGSTGTVAVRAQATGTVDAVFVVDGAEVARRRETDLADIETVLEVEALLSGPIMAIRCDESGTHRVDVVTDHPEGCEISAQPYGTYAEGKNGTVFDATATSPPGVCSMTIHY